MASDKQRDTIAMFKMTSYDSVTEVAGFTYIDDSNNVKSILLSKMIFRELMGDKQWNQKRFGQVSPQQFSFKSCLRTYGKDITNWNVWFDDKSNEIARESASRKKPGV